MGLSTTTFWAVNIKLIHCADRQYLHISQLVIFGSSEYNQIEFSQETQGSELKIIKQINRDASINTVAAYFINRPSVSAIYLFGSFAKGLARKNSDIDIGVLFAAGMSPLERFEQKLEITNDLEDLLKLKIDVVDLESADLFFLHQVMTHKLLLLDQDVNRRVFFEVKKRQEYFDRTHFYELYHRQALKRLDDQRSKYYHG